MALALTKDQLRIEAEKTQHVVNLIQQPGWKILESHFDNILEVLQLQLLTEKNPDEILRLQERYRAFQCMLEAASTLVAMRDVYERELQEIAAEELFKQRFAINN